MLRAKRVLRCWRCDADAKVANAAPRRHIGLSYRGLSPVSSHPRTPERAARWIPVTSTGMTTHKHQRSPAGAGALVDESEASRGIRRAHLARLKVEQARPH